MQKAPTYTVEKYGRTFSWEPVTFPLDPASTVVRGGRTWMGGREVVAVLERPEGGPGGGTRVVLRKVARTGPETRPGSEFRRAFSGIMPRREAAVLNATLLIPERPKPAQGGLRERLRRGKR